MSCNKDKSKIIDLEAELNKNIMAVNTGVLDSLGGSVQFGIGKRRQDMFWIVMAVIVAGVLMMVSVFSKKKRR